MEVENHTCTRGKRMGHFKREENLQKNDQPLEVQKIKRIVIPERERRKSREFI